MRFAAGGAGLIWFEAVSVVPEGRANPNQFWITEENVHAYKDLFNDMMNIAHETYGKDHTPMCIMQLTHSGRFSRPVDKPEPVIAYHNPYLNERMKIEADYPVITDEELEQLEGEYVKAAKLAKKAGFHGVDIKACHRYLISELLSAYNRKGKYGGDFEGRSRFLFNVIDKVKKELGNDFVVAVRANMYDGIPYPYGWGVNKDDYTKYDLTEPMKLVQGLYDRGVRLLNVTMGTPYYNPHVNRPYDKGGYIPEESQWVGVERLINGAGEIQKKFPDMVIIGTGYSWMRQFSANIGAGTLESGKAKMIGYGRQAFAYPDYAKDIIENGGLKKEKCCVACGKCTELMRANAYAGCVVRDSETYVELYKKYCMK
jgi:2,4-dienoyl-CoA reductase-like NADH-dependent reductase (Old Yellow Enzyme family)